MIFDDLKSARAYLKACRASEKEENKKHTFGFELDPVIKLVRDKKEEALKARLREQIIEEMISFFRSKK